MNIDGLGERIIETLIDEKIISNVADIYKLEDHKDKIINMEGFGQKSYDNFVKAISDSKTLPLNNVLFGLGIRHIGEKVAKSIATKYKSIDNIIKISKEEALDQYEIGPKITDSIIHYFSSEKNVNLINDLKANGVLFNEVKQIKIIESKYKNKKMVLTGTLSIPRDEMKKKLESLGVDVIGTISKNIDYLLAGENAGSKLDKAKTLKVEVISEDDINKLF
jgi:DNA ligase (NAD+)